jgi:hypothetical protein
LDYNGIDTLIQSDNENSEENDDDEQIPKRNILQRQKQKETK